MKPIIINSLDFFNEIFEVNLNKQPNQDFTTTINDKIFKIEVQTFINNKTQISFFKNDKFLGGGFIKAELNYLALSVDDDGAFFFLKNTTSDKIDFNYSDFGDNLKLYYATFADEKEINEMLESYYNLIENTQDLAVF